MVINNKSIIPEFTFERIINQVKTINESIRLDDLNMWYMMGYFIGDGWIEETKKSDGRSMNKIRFAINNKDYDEVYKDGDRDFWMKSDEALKYGMIDQVVT